MFILICSFDNIQSYENIDLWLNHINNTTKNLNKNLMHFIPILILINKNDIKNSEKKFKFSDVNQKIKERNLSVSLYTFSAKDVNYRDVFERLEFLLNENLDKSITVDSNKDKETAFSNSMNGSFVLNKNKKISKEKDIYRNSFKIKRLSLNTNEKKLNGSCC
jgi:hypothetical protein